MERLILKNLMCDDDYANKVYPFLKNEYFQDDDLQIFKIFKRYYEKYSFFPGNDEIQILLDKHKDEEEKLRLKKVLSKIDLETNSENGKFLLDETEEFIKYKDLQLNILKSVEIMQGKNKAQLNSIPSMLEESLSICFDTTIGLDMHETIEDRFKYYQKNAENGFKCDLNVLNYITNNGWKRKTLTTFIAPPHTGKSSFMTHLSTSFILNGYNVLYITLEMAEEEIAKRIDTNLLNIPIKDLEDISFDTFKEQYTSIMKNGIGKLIIKEYPTGGAHGMHFKALLKELEQKKGFKPDIIFVDYLGIMASVSDNMYDNIKRNAESLRAIAIEHNCAVFTASQTNRSGFDKTTGITMSDIAESTGPLQISDCVFGISKFNTGVEDNEKEDGSGYSKVVEQLLLINIIKNRLGGMSTDKFLLKNDYKYMRLIEVNTDNKKQEHHVQQTSKINEAAESSWNF